VARGAAGISPAGGAVRSRGRGRVWDGNGCGNGSRPVMGLLADRLRRYGPLEKEFNS
jgi:hypothetical protein